MKLESKNKRLLPHSTPFLVEKSGDVWMMQGKAMQSCAREIAETALKALDLDYLDFRLRDKLITAISGSVGAMMNAAHSLHKTR